MISFAPLWLGPSPSPSRTPSADPSCLNSSEVCQYIFSVTDQKWLAESSYWVLVKPARIFLIVLAALLARFLIHRAINRVISRTTDDSPGLLPRPLRGKVSDALRPPAIISDAVLPTERRQQRARALGSILRSIASVVVFATTAMLVLAELEVNLAPILASAGVVGLAVGFGAQNLVKDFLSGVFLLMEDQFGVGDTVELSQTAIGPLAGTIETVGLRITTVRDSHGAVWYIRNGEIVRVGNKSQGTTLAVVDVPVKPGVATEAIEVLRREVDQFVLEEDWTEVLCGPVDVLGIEEVTADSVILRTTAKTRIEAQAQVARELRRRLTEALADAGLITREQGQGKAEA